MTDTREVAIVVDAAHLIHMEKSAQTPHRIEEITTDAAAAEKLAYGVLHRTIVADCTSPEELKIAEAFARGSYSIRHVPAIGDAPRPMTLLSEVSKTAVLNTAARVIVLVASSRVAGPACDTVHLAGKSLLLVTTDTPRRAIGPDGIINIPFDLSPVVALLQQAASAMSGRPDAVIRNGRLATTLADLEETVSELAPEFTTWDYGKSNLPNLLRGIHKDAVQINGQRISIELPQE